MDEFKCNPFASRIVELFSEDGSGVISFQKFINIFSVFSPRATAETKTVWAFAIWDFDGAVLNAYPLQDIGISLRHDAAMQARCTAVLNLP